MYIVEISNGNKTTQIHGLRVKLQSGKITKGINTIDSFVFSMLPDNPGFNLTNEFTTLVQAYNTNKRRYDFVGRVLYAETSMNEDGLITKSVTCENFFGFLCDSVQTYVDTQNWTVIGLLQHLIDCHNSQVEVYKQFKIGTVTATDKNDNLYLGIQRENTWDAIKSKLIDKIGGELRFRVEDDGIYLDYLEQIGEEKTTEIALSVNMKAITREQNPSSFVTRLIPLGCKQKNADGEETEQRLDITSVNNGLNYIDDEEAINVYGVHVGIAEWDDVTDPWNLYDKGVAWIEENNKVQVKYSVTAIDLSLLGLALDDFDVGNWHPLKNSLMGIDDNARVIKKIIDICEEVQSSIEIGDSFKTLSDIQRDIAAQLKAAEESFNKNSQSVSNQLLQINKIIAESRAFIGVVNTVAYYYLSTSNTELLGGSWSETAPKWKEGCFYWQKIITTYTDDSTTESDPVCISGDKGEMGVGVDSIQTQFYLSNSKLTQSGGEWIATMPEWSRGHYLWTRSIITYSDGTTEYTEPICDTAWELVNEIEETFTTKIEQLERSITLEVSGSLGSEASIILSAGANKYTCEFDLSHVRQAFANDNTAISISAGIITFNSGTIVINSENFTVDKSGNITATNADISGIIKASSGRIGTEGQGWTIDSNSLYHGNSFAEADAFICTGSSASLTVAGHTATGWVFKAGSKFGVTSNGNLYCSSAYINGEVTTTDAPYKTELKDGSLRLYYDDVLCGTINTKYYSGASTAGISLRIENEGGYIMFCSPNSSHSTGFQVDYYLNYGWSSVSTYMHNFQTSARFGSEVYFQQAAEFERPYLMYASALKSYTDNDKSDSTELIKFYNDTAHISNNYIDTIIHGTTVYLKNTSTTVTSDRNAKNSIEPLPDDYEAFIDNLEPVRFKYNEGTSGRYHVGYIAQDVEAALTSAGLDTMDFAGYVNIGFKGELGLSYDEFIAILHKKIKRLEHRIAVLENNNEMESVTT